MYPSRTYAVSSVYQTANNPSASLMLLSRRLTQLRFATFALRAGISPSTSPDTWEPAWLMIDRHYGHLARGGREHAIRLLDTYRGTEPLDVHAVNTRWTLNDTRDASADNEKGG
jgi:hypothetical protein